MNASDIVASECMATIQFLQARVANLAIEIMALRQELEKVRPKDNVVPMKESPNGNAAT